jgi:hypothetical protein
VNLTMMKGDPSKYSTGIMVFHFDFICAMVPCLGYNDDKFHSKYASNIGVLTKLAKYFPI